MASQTSVSFTNLAKAASQPRDEWCYASDGWRGKVYLDGEDVGNRCPVVIFRGERPIAVELFVWPYIDDPNGEGAMREIKCGRIEVRNYSRLPAMDLDG